MPRAIHAPNTGGAVASVPSRRQLLGGATLAAVTGAAVGLAIVLPDPGEPFPAPANPDAELLALCAEAMRLDQACEAPHVTLHDCTVMLNRWQEVAEQIAATPALTLVGYQAKGAIIRHLMTPAFSMSDSNETKWDDAMVYGPLVWSLVHDLAGAA